MTDLRSRPFELASSIKSKYWSAVFFGAVLVYTVMLVVDAQSYSQDARVFPYMTGLILIGMLLVKLSLILLEDRVELSTVGLFADMSSLVEEDEIGDKPAQYRAEFVMIVWILGLVTTIWLFGFQLSIVMFSFTYIYVHEWDLLRAGSVTLGVWVFVYLIFIFLLDAPLYQGILTPDVVKEVLP